MNLSDIARLRLVSQQLAGSKFKSPKELVTWMGAVQAQDYQMAKWALGIRLPHSTEKMIEGALDRGEIIRTHVLRPTWHFVSADDIYWMLELTAPRIKASMQSRDKILGLTEAMVAKSNRVIHGALKPDRHLSRETLTTELQVAGLPTDNNRAWHLLLRAELDRIICGGPSDGKTSTYALFESRVPRRKPKSREESLAKLARTYFLSHGPATIRDFSWWSGLSMTDARSALEMIGSELASEKIDGNVYWLPKPISLRKTKRTSTHLLPAYDEFIISYKDRSATIDLKHQSKTVSNNGIFRPAIVINGRVSALWKRTSINGRAIVDVRFLRSHTREESRLIKKAGERYGEFLGRNIEMSFRT